MIIVVHASLPFTVLKLRVASTGSTAKLSTSRACLPTVYGFETRLSFSTYPAKRLMLVVHASLPFTVLKPSSSSSHRTISSRDVVHASLPFTVLKLYELCAPFLLMPPVVHASLPFTVFEEGKKFSIAESFFLC